MQHTSYTLWRKSSYSTAQSSCVKVADLPGDRCRIRDSQNPHLPALTFSSTEWHTFLTHVRTTLSATTPRSDSSTTPR